ncbi:MAG: DHH family phosphoesterase [Verrucomicrobiota bacterium]
METIYIVGHQNPDTDSGASATALADLLSKQNNYHKYHPVLLDAPIEQTRRLFDRANIPLPEVRSDLRYTVSECMREAPPVFSRTQTLRSAIKPIQHGTSDIVLIDSEGYSICGMISDRNSSNRFIYDANIEDFLGSILSLEDIVSGIELECLHEGSGKADEATELSLLSSPKQILRKSQMVVCRGTQDYLEKCRKSEVAAVVVLDTDISEIMDNLGDWNGAPVYFFPGSFFAFASQMGMCLRLENVMETEFLMLRPDQSIQNLKDTLAEYKHSLPVIDYSGKAVGSLSSTDLLGIRPRKIILVDHFEKDQSLPAIEEFDLIEVVDHHRIGNLESFKPVRVDCRPWGSTASIIASRYEETGTELSPSIALVLLGALVADTLLLTSPTATDYDRTIANRLAKIADVELENFGKEVLAWNDVVKQGLPDELVEHDCKQFIEDKIPFLLAQLETVELSQLSKAKIESLRAAMKRKCLKADCTFAILMITDVLVSDSLLLFISADTETGWWCQENDRIEKGMVSRKSQLVPWVLRRFKEGA